MKEASGSADYLEVDAGQELLAAAAAVALFTPSGASMTMIWLPQNIAGDDTIQIDENLCELAKASVDRVMSDHSELAELWSQDEIFAAVISQLRRTLSEPKSDKV